MTQVELPRWRYVALRLEAVAGAAGTAGAAGSGGAAGAGGADGRGAGPVAPPGRGVLQEALHALARAAGWAGADLPQLTRYAWPHAIVRVPRARVAAARELLPSLAGVVEGGRRTALRTRTLSTSGTLRALTQRLGLLQERGPRGRPEGGKEARSDSPRAAPAPGGPPGPTAPAARPPRAPVPGGRTHRPGGPWPGGPASSNRPAAPPAPPPGARARPARPAGDDGR